MNHFHFNSGIPQQYGADGQITDSYKSYWGYQEDYATLSEREWEIEEDIRLSKEHDKEQQ